nr:hypothetical protein [Tanacetum cinerariifolium]
MENTMLELVKICHQKSFFVCMIITNDLIESALNSKLLLINSQHLDKEEQEVKNVMEQPIENGTRTIESLQNFRVIHTNSTSLNNIFQISPVHAVAPILSTKEPEYSSSVSENEVTSEDKRECNLLVCENSPVCDDHSEIFSDSKNDDDISSDDDDFEDIEYVEASLLDPEIVRVEEENKLLRITRLITNIESLNDNPTPDRVLNSSESDNSLSDNFSPEFETFCDHTKGMRSGNTTTHADDSLPKYDSFCFEIEPDQERLINVMKNDISDNSSNDPLLEEADLFLVFDNSIPPGIENFVGDSEGDIRFLEALLIEDSIPFPNNESSESEDNPSSETTKR